MKHIRKGAPFLLPFLLLLLALYFFLPLSSESSDPSDIEALAPVEIFAEGLKEPTGVVVDQTGAVFVSDRKSGDIFKINGQVQSVASGLKRPVGLGFDKEGRLLVVEEGGGRLLRLESNGSFTVVAEGMKKPRWVALAEDGTIYLTAKGLKDEHEHEHDEEGDEETGEVILRLTPDALRLTIFADGFEGLQGIVVHKGVLFAAAKGLKSEPEHDHGGVFKIPVLADGNAGTITRLTQNEIKKPFGLVLDALEAFYVSAEELELEKEKEREEAIGKLAPDGVLTHFASKLKKPRGLAFDGSGNLYVAVSQGDEHGRILRLRSPPPPVVNLPAFTRQNPLTVGGTTEADSRIDAFLNDSPQPTILTSDGNFSLSFSLITNNQNLITIFTTAHNGQGLSSAPAEFTIIHDNIAPLIANLQPANGSFLNNPRPLIRADFSDNLSGIDVSKVDLRLDGFNVTAQASVTSSGFTLNLLNCLNVPNCPLSEGQHTVSVTIFDLAGNSVSASATFTVDVTAPLIANLTPAHGSVVTTATPLISAQFSDNFGINLASVRILLDGVDRTSQASISASGFTLDLLNCLNPLNCLNLSQGPHTVSVSLSDLAGNLASASSTFTVSLGPQLNPIGDKLVNVGSTLSFTVTATNPGGGALTFSVTPLPLPANATLDSLSGLFTFKPDLNQAGSFELTFSATANGQSDSETITITVPAPIFGATSLSGRLLDANAFQLGQTVPVVGAVVSILGTGRTAQSDANGNFTLTGLPSGAQIFDISTATAFSAPDGSPYGGFREEITLIAGVNNLIDRPFFLPRIAVNSLTTVNPNATTVVTNPDLGVTLFVPPHTAKDANGNDFTGQLSISIVPRNLAPAALPDFLDPGMLITIQPVGVTFSTPLQITFPNIDNLTPGSEADIWSLDARQGIFTVVGIGRVSADGTKIETISGGIRAADWHAAMAPSGSNNTDVDESDGLVQDPSKQCTPPAGSTVALQNGCLGVEFSLPSYRSLGASRSLKFIYKTNRANPQPVIPFNATIPVRAAVPPKMSYKLSVAGVDQGVETFVNTSGLNENIDETIRNAVSFDASSFKTGVYPYSIRLTSNYPQSRISSTISDRVMVVNEQKSSFGAGWGIEGIGRLHFNADGSAVVTDGNGAAVTFEPVRVNFATLEQGASINAISSRMDDPNQCSVCADPRDVLGGSFSLYFSGEKGNFIFDIGDLDQFIIVDLGQTRTLDRVGASFVGGTGDREVFDFVEILTSLDGVTFVSQGIVGLKGVGDELDFTLVSPVFFDIPPQPARYVRYNFGHHSPDHGGGSRILRVFAESPAGSFVTPSGDFSLLAKHPDGTFTRAFKDDTKVNFNAQGLQTSVVDRNGNTTSYSYDGSGRLLSITDPAGLITNFSYAGSLVSSVTDPSGRTTSFASDAAGNLTKVTFPDGSFKSFGYDSKHLMTSETNERGFTVQRQYDSVGRLTRATLPDGTVRSATSAQSVGFADPSTGVGTITNPAPVARPASALSTFSDGNGNQQTVKIGKFGAPQRITDPLGQTTIIERRGGNDATLFGGAGFSQGQLSQGFLFDGADDFAETTRQPLDPDTGTVEFWFRADTSNRFMNLFYVGNDDGFTEGGGGNVQEFSIEIQRDSNQLRWTWQGGVFDQLGFNTIVGIGSGVTIVPGQFLHVAVTYDRSSVARMYVNGALKGEASFAGKTINTNLWPNFALFGANSRLRSGQGTLTQRYQGLIDEVRVYSRPLSAEEIQALFSAGNVGNRAAPPPGLISWWQGEGNAIDSAGGAGLPTKITRPNGAVTTMSYDDRGNLLTSTDPVGASTTFAYEPSFNQVASIRDPKGNTTTITYDAKGNPTQIRDSQGNLTQMSYDARGLLTSVTDPQAKTTSFSYDLKGNLITTTDPLGQLTTLQYDQAGNVVKSTDGAGRVTEFTYDSFNRLVSVLDPDLRVTRYSYDQKGNLTEVMDANAQRTSFTYDVMNRLVSATNPVGLTEAFSYDANGNLVSTTKRDLQSVAFDYDSLNRLIKKTLPGNQVTSFNYDSVGNLTSVVDPDSAVGMAYDLANRLTSTTASTPSVPAKTISYAYDLNGNRTTMTDPQGRVTSYVYDSLNRLTSLTNPSGGATSFAYDSLGRRTSMTHANGVVSTYSYDAASQLLSLVHQLGAATINSFTYTYDAVGNRKTKGDNNGVANYTYDALNRLVQATNPLPSNPLETYTYDPVGNRTNSNQNGASIFNQANQLTEDTNFTYQYDNNGNLTRKTAKVGGQITSYEYDAENKLVRVVRNGTTVNYKYDGLGRRVEKEIIDVATTVTRYIYDNEDILLELDGSNNIVARYTHGPGIDEPLIMERGGQSFFYHADGLGSITEITDSAGIVKQRYTYSSFGKIESQLDPNFIQPYTFTSREFDAETGLYHYRERQHDWRTGRFTTEDPIGFDGGDNFYVYVGNNAINFNDPFGLFLLPINLIPPNIPGLNLPVPSPENSAISLPPIPYGNYGGKGWTGGYTGTRKPIDSLDECFKSHDECYGAVQSGGAKGPCGGGLTNKSCDKKLIDCMRMLPPDPRQWQRPAPNPPWANVYRYYADWYFR